jgi:hypothetical protein
MDNTNKILSKQLDILADCLAQGIEAIEQMQHSIDRSDQLEIPLETVVSEVEKIPSVDEVKKQLTGFLSTIGGDAKLLQIFNDLGGYKKLRDIPETKYNELLVKIGK